MFRKVYKLKQKTMQSLSRQLKRGNAVMVFSEVTKQIEVVSKLGTPSIQWNRAVKLMLPDSAMQYRVRVAQPLHRLNHGFKPAEYGN